MTRAEWVGTAVKVSESVSELGESPLWDADAGLRWLDIEGQRLFTLNLDGTESSVALSAPATAIELASAETLLAVTRSGFGWLDAVSGVLAELRTTVVDDGVSMNDGAIDPRGRCWAGSAVRDDSRRGVLYRVDDQGVTPILRGLGMSNGIDFSPDSDVLYHVDSSAGMLTAWDYDLSSGDLGDSRDLVSVPAEVGLPDGLTVDAEGDIWLAIWGPGQVWRIDPRTGETTGVVEVPTPCTTSCAFGGPDLSTLYITTANYANPPGGGLLYAAHNVPARGRLSHRFAGALV